jgi:hypothetical protein
VSDVQLRRAFQPGDVLFTAFLIIYAAVSISLIPFDFTDLCYLFSLEQGTWATQEWVHPIYVPTLSLIARALRAFGYHGHMLVPVELFNVTASVTAFVLLYRLARRVPGASLAAAVTLGVTATCIGFWDATMRSTPYALALLCQVLSLRCLISESPVRAHRYALAGVFAGLAMGLHASAMALGVVGVACALFDPDATGTREAKLKYVAAFGGAMLATALFDWGVFVTYNRIGLDYFRNQDFHSTFLRIEQVPSTSIYTSGSVSAQLSTFAASVQYQAGAIVWLALVFAVPIAVRRLWVRTALNRFERRLAVASGANFAAIAGFFLINNTHNGFIFASLTLVPVLLAVGLRESWVALAALVVLAVPGTRENIHRVLQAGAAGANDPTLAEVRFLEQTLGRGDVLLTPGSPFPEMLYLSHLNALEVSLGDPTHNGTEVPLLHPGDVLRARVAWWLSHGSRVFYALGDDSTDFTGDVGGAEKEHQIFWRPETAARERAPVLREIRAALERSGLEIVDGLVSPRGEHYAEIRLRERDAAVAASPPAAAVLHPTELYTLFARGDSISDEPMLPRRAQFLVELAAAIPDDPWLSCDVMALVCKGEPQRDGKLVPCRPLTGCDESVGKSEGIVARAGEPEVRPEPVANHLTPAVAQVLQDTAADALKPVTQRGFSVSRVDIHHDEIELEIQDRDDRLYAITLALPDSRGVPRAAAPDGRGEKFLFYLTRTDATPNPEASTALLAAASNIDRAVMTAAP